VSGRTARRARREREEQATRLLDSYHVFSSVLSEEMGGQGIGYDSCTRTQVDSTIAICCEEFERCWDEFVLWVVHGDDERAKTLEIVHALGRRHA
jgi:hypothetical protein